MHITAYFLFLHLLAVSRRYLVLVTIFRQDPTTNPVPLHRKSYPMHLDPSLLDKLNNLKHIPTLPHILLHLIKVCNADNGNLKEISKIIEKDPALTSRVLKLVNSAYYSKDNRIRSVDGAVIFLGTNAVKNIAICSCIHEVFHKVKSGAGFNLKHFWWHSLRSAILAKSIAKKQKFRDPEEAFLFGILHDLGKIILWINFPEQYSDLLKKRKSQPDLILAGETQLGANHAEIGAWLLNKWNFQHDIVDAVLCHHHSLYSILNAPQLAKFIYVANLLSSDSSQKIREGFTASQKIFGFTQPDAEELLNRADDELKTMAESLNIEIAPFKSNDFNFSEDDREKEKHLSKEVWNRSLLLSTIQNLLGATDEATIWKETAQGLQILFELNTFLFFVIDPEINGLRKVTLPDAANSSKIKDMIVPMKMENSLLIKCLKTRKIADSFHKSPESSPCISDRKIIQLIDKQGIACIPMVAHDKNIGVIVLGLDLTEYTGIESQIKPLQMLADHASIAMHVHHPGRSQLQEKKSKRQRHLSSSTINNAVAVNEALGIIKKYLKIPWIKSTKIKTGKN